MAFNWEIQLYFKCQFNQLNSVSLVCIDGSFDEGGVAHLFTPMQLKHILSVRECASYRLMCLYRYDYDTIQFTFSSRNEEKPVRRIYKHLARSLLVCVCACERVKSYSTQFQVCSISWTQIKWVSIKLPLWYIILILITAISKAHRMHSNRHVHIHSRTHSSVAVLSFSSCRNQFK